jgi:hypothetical protein
MRLNRWIGAEASLCPASTDTEYRTGGNAFAEYRFESGRYERCLADATRLRR